MATTEIRQRHRVHHAVRRSPQAIHQYLLCIRAGDRVHRVELDSESIAEQGADRRKIEQRFHQLGVGFNRIDHRHRHITHLVIARSVQFDSLCIFWRIDDLISGDFFACREDRFRDRLGRRAAVVAIVFDAEIAIRSARIVAGRQDDAAMGAVFADEAGGGRRRKDAAHADQHAREPVCRCHFQNDLDRFEVVIASVTAQHQRRTVRDGDGIKNGLHEIFQVARLLKNRHAFA